LAGGDYIGLDVNLAARIRRRGERGTGGAVRGDPVLVGGPFPTAWPCGIWGSTR
jgi:hypothetical protein